MSDSRNERGRNRSVTKVAPIPSRRDCPPRIRKRNRLFFNDDEDTSYAPPRASPRKTPRLSGTRATAAAVATAASVPDKKVSQTIYLRLRNLLKLPKAHKWVCYEFFYSNLDLPLFKGDNDFCICLKESFPNLKTRNMTRVEWCKSRRLMGKPRRCSTAFFAEERSSLNHKRSKIRLLQQRKVSDVTHFKELPEEIPLPLVIGTKVTARLRKPQDGLFTGSIDAVDTSNATYRVTFDKQGLGTHSIPDYEVLSNEQQETMPLAAFAQTNRLPRPQVFTSPTRLSAPTLLDNDPILSGSNLKTRLLGLEGGTLGGFPIKFLVLVVCLTKILNTKRDKIGLLKNMNTEAERLKSYQEPITMDFKKRYAGIVLELEKLNKDLNEYLVEVQQFCQEEIQLSADSLRNAVRQSEIPITSVEPTDEADPGIPVHPVSIRERCGREATAVVEKGNKQLGRRAVGSQRMIGLVTAFTSLMLQMQALAENEMNSFELKSLTDTVNDIKTAIDPTNASMFQHSVEVHVNHIQSGLSRLGNLHAFASQVLPL